MAQFKIFYNDEVQIHSVFTLRVLEQSVTLITIGQFAKYNIYLKHPAHSVQQQQKLVC
jgi:hypothetical protein